MDTDETRMDKKVIVELKVASEYNRKDEAQLLNQLKATGIDVGLLINLCSGNSKQYRSAGVHPPPGVYSPPLPAMKAGATE